MNMLQQNFHWLVVLLATIYAVGKAIPPDGNGANQIDYAAIGQLPVKDDGRIKPLDTVARTLLLGISEREQVTDQDGKNPQPAIRWFLDVASSPPREGAGAQHPVFRITNDQVLNFLDLKPKPGFYRYSYAEIDRSVDKFLKEYNRVQEMPPKKRELFHDKIFELGKRLGIYFNLCEGKLPELVPPQEEDLEWHSLGYIEKAILRPYEESMVEFARNQVKDDLTKLGKGIEDLSDRELAVANQKVVRLIIKAREMVLTEKRPTLSPAAEAFRHILRLYAAGDATEFNQAVKDFREKYHKDFLAPSEEKVGFEWYFNQVSPFYTAAMLYLMVLALACVGWLIYPRELQLAAFSLAIVALVVHTLGLLGRMYLQGRPPVTNLYASSVFIGWGGVLLCLGMERIYRNGIGNVLAAVVGAATVMIAKNLAESLALDEGADTLQNLAAVLDTNFWLATHVTSVTLGYTATYVAGLIGIVYIFRGILTPSLDESANKTLGKMMYGVVCFATFLSFVGTVLGGIWADQSWGRFWGWDPKENGAVLIVIWNSLILHARWSGLVKQRGMALLTVVGVMITTWSWFGTNQLGVGLHAYGFDNTLAKGCRTTWLVCLGIIALGSLPLRYWRSFSDQGRLRIAESATKLRPKGKIGTS